MVLEASNVAANAAVGIIFVVRNTLNVVGKYGTVKIPGRNPLNATNISDRVCSAIGSNSTTQN